MLTRQQVEGWQTSHLDQAALQLHSMGRQSEDLFGLHVRNLAASGGSRWQGQASDAAQIAQRGAADIAGAKTNVLEAITETEADGFRVGADLSVTDTRSASDDQHQRANREALGRQHAEYIRFRAAQLAEADELVGRQLKAKRVNSRASSSTDKTAPCARWTTGHQSPNPVNPRRKRLRMSGRRSTRYREEMANH
ncbi:hypothetical protein [Mycobacteroides abscessus]|uniref:hypothetical protein n=1 Tax=Mycobacteroides abscessus TaxID=36809 RepID=UPI0005DC811C|nr:hypothetical protein [Mycobacteroides abscessus]CPU35469.1 putative transmembrane protein [Mycobacteroides abscessus]